MKAKLTPEEIKNHINIASVVGEYVSMKKNGLNYFGNCPFHQDKSPSFSVNETKQMFYCFGCGAGGDVYEFLIKINNMSFVQAYMHLADRVGCDTTESSHNETKPQPREFTPTEHSGPAQLWQERAERFVIWAQGNLKNNQEVMAWLSARGIDQPTAEVARLGWNPGEDGKDIFRARKAWSLPELLKENGKPRMLWIPRGLVIPYCPPPAVVHSGGGVVRIRIRRPEELRSPEEKRPYYIVPGSSMSTMIIGPERRAFVVVESELDAIACAAATDLAGAVALGTLQGKPDAAAYAVLKDAIQILNALDYGDTGGGKTAAERAMKWWSDNFNDRCDRWPVPKGKDPGEAHAMGIALISWIEAGLPPVITMNRKARSATSPVALPTSQQPSTTISKLPEGTHPLLAELWTLLLSNPGVKIINTPDRFTILRNGKYVGGRINHLVMREKEVTDYILDHPSEEIDYRNLIT